MNAFSILHVLLDKLEDKPGLEGDRNKDVEDALKKELKISLSSATSDSTQDAIDVALDSSMLILDQIDSYRISLHSEAPNSPFEARNFIGSTLSMRQQPTIGFSSLPGEILCGVFRLILGDLDYDKPKNAIILSGINKKCRELVISTPSFWDTLISDLGPGLTRISIQRSSHSRLSLHIGARISRLEVFLELVKNDYEQFSCVKFHDFRGWKTFTYFFKDCSFLSLSILSIKEGVLKDEFVSDVLAAFQMPNLTRYEGPWFTLHKRVAWMKNLRQVSFLVSSDEMEDFFDLLHGLKSCRHLELHFVHSWRCIHGVAETPEARFWDDKFNKSHTMPSSWRFSTRGDYNNIEDAETDPASDDSGGGQTASVADGKRRKSNLPKLRHLAIDIKCHNLLSMLTSGFEEGVIPLSQITYLKITIRIDTQHYFFQDMFHSRTLGNLTEFDVTYAGEGENSVPIPLSTMVVLENLTIEGATNENIVEGYMVDAKNLTALKTMTLRNCEIQEETLLELAHVLVEPTRLHPFDLLRLYGCRLSPSTLTNLRSIMPLRKFQCIPML